ncbi:MAG: DUF2971 domain-containing protein [bacterium]|nr:DUF2971 domain-containing protein [bacterium]
MLSKNIVYFASPSEFNDPFDCTIPIRFDLASKDSLINLYYRQQKLENPTMKDVELRKRAKDIYKSKRHKDPLFVRQVNNNILDKIKNNVGICSLTPECKNLLMWSHYTNSHKGFCVCFNVKILLAFIYTFNVKYNYEFALFKVDYSREYPILNPSILTGRDKISNILTKSDVWAYENEYRLILLNGAKLEAEMPENVIKRVILGCQISNKDKGEIISILKEKKENVYLYQSKLLENKYGLEFEQIKYK